MLQHCYFQDKHASEKHACGHKPTFTAPGVQYVRHQNSTLWQAGVIDWSRKLLDFMYIDNACGTGAQGCKAGAKVNVTIIVVAAGHRLKPPSNNWKCPPEWDCDMSATSNGGRFTSAKPDQRVQFRTGKEFTITSQQPIQKVVFTGIDGRIVRSIQTNDNMVRWEFRNSFGKTVSSGSYLCTVYGNNHDRIAQRVVFVPGS